MLNSVKSLSVSQNGIVQCSGATKYRAKNQILPVKRRRQGKRLRKLAEGELGARYTRGGYKQSSSLCRAHTTPQNQAKLQIQPTDPRSTREGNWDTLQGHQYSISPDKFEMISARELSLHAEIKNQNPGNVVNENN